MADIDADPGDTIEVDYSVENTGELDGTQDIVLTRENGDKTTVDQAEGISLQPDDTDSGTLVWEDVPEGSYTLCVESDDTSSCLDILAFDIPDSAIANYDAQADSQSTGSISSVPDQIDSLDLSGTAELVSDGINGHPAYYFNGDDYSLDVTFGNEEVQPITVVLVVEIENQSTNQRSPFDGVDSRVEIYWNNDSDEWRIYAGSSGVGGSSTTKGVLTAIFDGSDSEFRLNGSQISTGDAGSNDLDGVTLGYSQTLDGRYFDGYIGEAIPYAADLRDTGELASEEQRIADKWDISI